MFFLQISQWNCFTMYKLISSRIVVDSFDTSVVTDYKIVVLWYFLFDRGQS